MEEDAAEHGVQDAAPPLLQLLLVLPAQDLLQRLATEGVSLREDLLQGRATERVSLGALRNSIYAPCQRYGNSRVSMSIVYRMEVESSKSGQEKVTD